MTLVELVAALGLLMVVLAALLTVLEGSQRNVDTEISRTASNDAVRLAAQSIDREVRSGEVLYDPATESYPPGDVVPGMSMRVFTQSNEATRGQPSCDQWRITSSGDLQQRRWTLDWPSNPSGVTPWRTVASHLTNRTDGVPAFSRPSPSVTNLVVVDLRANNSARHGATVEVKLSLSGRNTIQNTSQTICGPATPDPSMSGPPGTVPVPPY